MKQDFTGTLEVYAALYDAEGTLVAHKYEEAVKTGVLNWEENSSCI